MLAQVFIGQAFFCPWRPRSSIDSLNFLGVTFGGRHVCGKVIKAHTRDFDYTQHASPDDPQYEIKSHKTEHIAAHKGSALRNAHR